MLLDDKVYGNRIGRTNHEWAKHYNEWDPYITFLVDKIWLFRAARDRIYGIRHYPMIIPAPLDYGSATSPPNINVKNSLSRYIPVLFTSNLSTVMYKDGVGRQYMERDARSQLP